MDQQQRTALAAWLMEAEKAFGNFGVVFSQIATGEHMPERDQAVRLIGVAAEFESQARQLRTLITTASPDSLM